MAGIKDQELFDVLLKTVQENGIEAVIYELSMACCECADPFSAKYKDFMAYSDALYKLAGGNPELNDL